MFEYIKGALVQADPSKAIVDVQGVGYLIFIPFNNYSKLPQIGSSVIFYVAHVVREDSQKLYGFLKTEERELFNHLINISGIGPKTALCLVGHMEIGEFQMAIATGNIQVISKIPGIGKKTAERLVIEMRDKIKNREGLLSSDSLPSLSSQEKGVVADALSALLNLGYNSTQAQKAVKSALGKGEEEPGLAELITSALRCI